MTDDDELQAKWEQEELPKILAGECWDAALRTAVDAEFSAYCGLEGLRGPFYLGVESCNCCGSISNPYPSDGPKSKAFHAGYRFGTKRWGSGY